MKLSDQQKSALTDITGPKGVIIDADSAPYLTEWRDRWPGKTPLILAPATTGEVSKIVGQCHDHGIGITPQGGNTGLVGGQIPHGEILITCKRLNQIREVSALNNTISVDAGVTLTQAQSAAKNADRLFPLSIGSEGSCQVGGAISTNAGGVNVIRYGNMRDLVLGIEAVLPNGDIWNGLNALRKNNTGYDLKHLFIGGEGTLGIVTGATLKVFPRPQETVTAFAAVPDPQAAVDLLSHMQDATGGLATSFELMSDFMVDLVMQNISGMRRLLADRSAWYVLMEFSTGRAGGLKASVESILSGAYERGLISDATIAENGTQADQFWALRHNAAPAMAKDPARSVKCDISVPIHRVPGFLDAADERVKQQAPGARIVAFGHIGDGNIHYDVLGPENQDQSGFTKIRSTLELSIHDIVVAYEGSISAEHGIGVLKRDELKTRKSPVELAMMQAVKQALDPKGIMNPGKLL